MLVRTYKAYVVELRASVCGGSWERLEGANLQNKQSSLLLKGGGKNEDFQKMEMALEGKLFVLEGCPFHSL